MQYQISYFSPNAHAQELARGLRRMLPGDACLCDLGEETRPCADVQLVGFDFTGTNIAAIPIPVMEYLDRLEGKTIVLFATVPFRTDGTVERQVHNHAAAFLPRECDFRGLFLCEAEPSGQILKDITAVVSGQPENSRAKHWLERCRHAVGHPDEADIQRACRFVKHVLELD